MVELTESNSSRTHLKVVGVDSGDTASATIIDVALARIGVIDEQQTVGAGAEIPGPGSRDIHPALEWNAYDR